MGTFHTYVMMYYSYVHMYEVLLILLKVLITTIKIGWCEIGSNFQLLPITVNYYQLKMVITFWSTIYFISKFNIEINLKKRFFTLNFFHFHHFIVFLLTLIKAI